MAGSTVIRSVRAREIIDSRGMPTVEATVVLCDGSAGTAAVPSGASTGQYEAHELRDGDSERFFGKGVLSAVGNVNGEIAEELVGMKYSQTSIDRAMLMLDGTDGKSRLGANAVLAVSLAAAKAAAKHYGMPLFRFLGGIGANTLPVPMMNILNGGAHASNSIDVQEFMIMPVGFSSFREALRAGCEIYRALGEILKHEGKSTSVGDEGGYAPEMSDDREALDHICRAIEKAGYGTDKVKIALDAATGEWQCGAGEYRLPKSGETLSSSELIGYWKNLAASYPIVSLEDPLGDDDHFGWENITRELGSKVALVGDDLFVTNISRLREGILRGEGNAILIKPNQIGTLSETLAAISHANKSGYRSILSHRSGETEDTTVADIAVAVGCGYIKTGAPCRSERVAKYNRLLRIENYLGDGAVYGRRQ